MSKARKILIIAIVAVALVLLSWAAVYAAAAKFVTLTPGKSTFIADEKPEIRADWRVIPGVRLSGARVFLDGKEVTGEAKITSRGVSFVPDKNLTQGRHVVEAELSYNILVNRKVDARWTFKIDTVPPALKFKDNATFVVSPASDYVIKGKSEPGTKIIASLNGQPLKTTPVSAGGNFSLSVAGLEKKNELKLAAADSVGNLRTVIMPVIKDETSPTVKSMFPAENETVRIQAPKIAVSFDEQDSGLKNIRLSIDDTLAVSKEWSPNNDISYLGGLLSDGLHKAKVEATDYAGRNIVKEWNFTIDSRKIVINRGERRLYFYRNGGLQKVYPVAVGMPQYPTPSGRFRTTVKQRYPTWRNPGSEWAKTMPPSIPPGPGNPLGTRAIGINYPAIFIHGTYNAASIGTAASHGCIRMNISDIEQFFEMVGPGIPVDIVN